VKQVDLIRVGLNGVHTVGLCPPLNGVHSPRTHGAIKVQESHSSAQRGRDTLCRRRAVTVHKRQRHDEIHTPASIQHNLLGTLG
jgi:hypothetical protein